MLSQHTLVYSLCTITLLQLLPSSRLRGKLRGSNNSPPPTVGFVRSRILRTRWHKCHAFFPTQTRKTRTLCKERAKIRDCCKEFTNFILVMTNFVFFCRFLYAQFCEFYVEKSAQVQPPPPPHIFRSTDALTSFSCVMPLFMHQHSPCWLRFQVGDKPHNPSNHILRPQRLLPVSNW